MGNEKEKRSAVWKKYLASKKAAATRATLDLMHIRIFQDATAAAHKLDDLEFEPSVREHLDAILGEADSFLKKATESFQEDVLDPEAAVENMVIAARRVGQVLGLAELEELDDEMEESGG